MSAPSPILSSLETSSAVPHRGDNHRFTIDGDADLEQHLASICEAVSLGVQKIIPASRLEGLFLAGGYGRGEGGVLRTGSGADDPYNDMEFYVFAKGPAMLNDRRYKHALHELGEHLSESAGIEVEFKILSLATLRTQPVTMFSYDFIMKHRWQIGGDHLLHDCAHHRQAAKIPLYEAMRLMLNRCTGLVLAKERLRRPDFTSEDADFVGRNMAKAQMALGDAWLTALGKYHWSCLERHRRLEHAAPDDLPDAQLLLQHHEAGVHFKLHPHRANESRETLARRHAELSGLMAKMWLKLESMRLGTSFRTMDDYISTKKNLCPEQPAWRNVLVNFRRYGFRSVLMPEVHLYPRERLFRALAVLLWQKSFDHRRLATLQNLLQTRECTFPKLVRAYHQLWSQFN